MRRDEEEETRPTGERWWKSCHLKAQNTEAFGKAHFHVQNTKTTSFSSFNQRPIVKRRSPYWMENRCYSNLIWSSFENWSVARPRAGRETKAPLEQGTGESAQRRRKGKATPPRREKGRKTAPPGRRRDKRERSPPWKMLLSPSLLLCRGASAHLPCWWCCIFPSSFGLTLFPSPLVGGTAVPLACNLCGFHFDRVIALIFFKKLNQLGMLLEGGKHHHPKNGGTQQHQTRGGGNAPQGGASLLSPLLMVRSSPILLAVNAALSLSPCGRCCRFPFLLEGCYFGLGHWVEFTYSRYLSKFSLVRRNVSSSKRGQETATPLQDEGGRQHHQRHHLKRGGRDTTQKGKTLPPPPLPSPRERKGGERSSTNWQIIVPFFDRGTGTTIDIRSTWKHLNIDVFPDIPTTWRDKRWATSDTRLHAKNARDLRTIEACRCSLVSGYNTYVSQRLCARALERSECSKVAVFEKKNTVK